MSPTPNAFPLLSQIDSPADLRRLSEDQLQALAIELREFVVHTISQCGGHFAANLGVVELTIALHYVLNTPEDRLVWDVGHQAYPHKVLTGRRDRLSTVRQKDGLHPFPWRGESEYDTFAVGHSSTSISAALGMAIAARKAGSDRKVVAVIGDGAMTAGMAFEAMNHAADVDAKLLVILNDNEMSISENVGGLNRYLTKILASRTYAHLREGSKKVLSKMPLAWEFARRVEEHAKGMVAPGTLFEELGFNYIGPINGHDLPTLIHTLDNMKDLTGPQFLHVVTKKGKGYSPAEKDPIGYHATGKFDPKLDYMPKAGGKPSYANIFGEWLCDMAAADPKLMAITPAMREGSGMVRFAREFPGQYVDVGIAEQHAVTLAAGMACDGLKPVVAIYSTFLQRAYDQLIHDVALQNLPVLFAIDRAGLVGGDGATHNGAFDLSFLRCIPNMLIMAPSDENECRQMLYTGFQHGGPAAVRYPRGAGMGVQPEKAMTALPIGKARVLREGRDIAILSFGGMLPDALAAGDSLGATVVDMRFVKPLDEALLRELAKSHRVFITVEENAVQGGAGSAVNEFVLAESLSVEISNLGLPDRFIHHGEANLVKPEFGLDAKGIVAAAERHRAPAAGLKAAG
ncbi:MAG: 1-deoxy-D-xylulose-5-phosphate synthase [Gammaproteobacteria bacterium]|nr:1-deoxy-D-xylulose-5-phosphate synthase [Gammaproteobacteria bacterium]